MHNRSRVGNLLEVVQQEQWRPIDQLGGQPLAWMPLAAADRALSYSRPDVHTDEAPGQRNEEHPVGCGVRARLWRSRRQVVSYLSRRCLSA